MARQRRVWSPHLYYHVVMRGNNRQEIFHHPSDYRMLLQSLHYTYERHPFSLAAYCIMNNHYHLLIRSPVVHLGKVMGRLNKKYGDYYRSKYDYTGFLYEGRYYAEKITNARSLLRISRYIHRNPIDTKFPLVDQMENYPYSSFTQYATATSSDFPFFDNEIIQLALPYMHLTTMEDYLGFCREAPEDEMDRGTSIGIARDNL
ncbi:transposase [Sporosarcina sp. OR05]|uniref:transposase n=1 Tax=Sporosarcina sp. OR05 TaxID=2969819 RepID=UPI00352A9EAF